MKVRVCLFFVLMIFATANFASQKEEENVTFEDVTFQEIPLLERTESPSSATLFDRLFCCCASCCDSEEESAEPRESYITIPWEKRNKDF